MNCLACYDVCSTLLIGFVRIKARSSGDAAAVETVGDTEVEGADNSVGLLGSLFPKLNNKGLYVLTNNVVSIRLLDLAARVPAKTHDSEALKLFNCRLLLSKVFTLMSFIFYCKHTPVEKHRDGPARSILHMAAPYCLSKANLQTILEADPDELSAYLIGTSSRSIAMECMALSATGLAIRC